MRHTRIGRRTFGAGLAAAAIARPASAQARHYSFAYDQPHTTGYGIGADLFDDKLSELSQGTMIIDQFPGAQLGQEPQMLQKIRTGDIDFMFSSSANAATVSPRVRRAVDPLPVPLRGPTGQGDRRPAAGRRDARRCSPRRSRTATCWRRRRSACATSMASGRSTRSPTSRACKVRVQATPTEDTMFPAYGAQTVHMPFGSVYTSLQTGVVDLAENGINVYDSNKHYEVAPVLSMTEHEANNSVHLGQRQAVERADRRAEGLGAGGRRPRSARRSRRMAIALEHKSLAKLQKIGVKFVTDVDKAGFIKIAEPMQDKIATGLGPHAEKILRMICRSIAVAPSRRTTARRPSFWPPTAT